MILGLFRSLETAVLYRSGVQGGFLGPWHLRVLLWDEGSFKGTLYVDRHSERRVRQLLAG